ncbi:hypothetical protein [Microbulbifer sp. ALW1]|uniref:hypothetical protein n=1 Tax=Microbulbifer sp. (strain ALW1) TaxID=1516059 RepID=UPI0013597DF2|nr:hypothetical protein [Microbulbifer sp. ALW1]
MNKIFSTSLAIAGLSFSATAFSASCADINYVSGSYPEGTDYPLKGVATAYNHDADWNYSGETADFATSAGYLGSDEYNYQDFKWRAKTAVTFPFRGPNWVTVFDPVTELTHCNNVFVQEKPKATNPTLNVTSNGESAYVSLNYEIDSYSKAARNNDGVITTFYWEHNGSGIQNAAGTVYRTALTGSASRYIDFPSTTGTYSFSASVSDGTYKTTLFLGNYVVQGGGTKPPCPTCEVP